MRFQIILKSHPISASWQAEEVNHRDTIYMIVSPFMNLDNIHSRLQYMVQSQLHLYFHGCQRHWKKSMGNWSLLKYKLGIICIYTVALFWYFVFLLFLCMILQFLLSLLTLNFFRDLVKHTTLQAWYAFFSIFWFIF